MTDLERALELARSVILKPDVCSHNTVLLSEQLLSLHAECEKWKQQTQWSIDNEFRLSDEIKKLKAECEALRKTPGGSNWERELSAGVEIEQLRSQVDELQDALRHNKEAQAVYEEASKEIEKLRDVAAVARAVEKIYWDFDKSMKVEVEELKVRLAALDAKDGG